MLRKSASAGLITALWIQSAFAQSILDDPRRRKFVLPSVRDATECLGREALNEDSLAAAIRDRRLRDVLAGPMRRCADDVEAMIATHDRAYYPGAGEAFFRGPYLTDLPRAILRRVQPELDRRESENRQREAVRLQAEETARLDAQKQAAPPVQPLSPAVPQRPMPAVEPRPVVEPPSTTRPERAVEKKPADGDGIPGFVLGVVAVLIAVGALKLAGDRADARRAREAAEQHLANLRARYGDESVVQRILAHEVWAGMTREMLIDSRGRPVDTGERVMRGKTTETFKYGQTGRNRYATRIYVEDEIVIGWEDK